MSEIIKEPDGATKLDPDKIEGLLHKHVQTREQLDELEQSNIQDGLQWLERQKTVDPFTFEFIRKLHEKLFGEVWEWAGGFRKTAKNIGCEACDITTELHKLLGDARYWIENETFSPVELAVRFHHRLVEIHLFPNGNGRHARIMADVILKKIYHRKPIDWAHGYDMNSIKSERRKQYIAALKRADKHDYQPLLDFVTTQDI